MLALSFILLACASPPSVSPVSAAKAEEPVAVMPPPCYELNEMVLSGQEWRKGPHNAYLPYKRIVVPIRTFVPRGHCWELTAEGQFHFVPDFCSTPPSMRALCN